MKQSVIFRLLALVALVFAVGCGGGSFSTAPVNGVVTLDGEPIEGLVVTFNPVATGDNAIVGPFSYGRTDAAGKFEMQLRKNQGTGVVVGEHQIEVAHPDYDPGSIAELEASIEDQKRNEMDTSKLEAQLARLKKAMDVKIPAKYAENSPLKVTVPREGLKDYKIELTSE